MASDSPNWFLALQEPDDEDDLEDASSSANAQEGWEDDLTMLLGSSPRAPGGTAGSSSRRSKPVKKAKKRQKSLKVKLLKTAKTASGQEICEQEIAWLNCSGPTSLQKTAMSIGFPS
jgi:hypothetical protein